MTEGKEKSAEAKPINPLFSFIESNYRIGSVRELIGKGMREIDEHDLPEDPEDLKKVLNEAIDYADSLRKAQ
jgi:predicted RNA-binding protein